MPSVSKQQQKLFALVKAYKDGKNSKVDQKVKDIAGKISDEDADDFASTDTKDLPTKVKKEESIRQLIRKEIESINEAEKKRDHAKEYQARKSYYYKKFQSSPEKKKYRAELNKYNRDNGTYGNGDGKDASHKNGKIAGYEDQSKNRGRAEGSRVKGSKRKKAGPNEEITMNEVKTEFKIGDITVGKDNKGISTQNFGIRYYYQKPKGAKHMESDLGKFMVSLGNMVSNADKAKITKRLKESTEEQMVRNLVRSELKEVMKKSTAYGYTKDGIVKFKGSKKDSTKKAKAEQKKSPESKISIFMNHGVNVGDKYGQKNEIDLPANLHLRRAQMGTVGDMS
jgi:hypothetical protein